MKKDLLTKTAAAVLSAALLLTGLTACQDTRPNTGDRSAGDPAAAHEPLTILTGQQNYGAFVDLLQERYPEVQLEFISFSGGATSSYMQETLERGVIPDIYTVTFVPDGATQKEQLLDLSNYSVVNQYPSTMLDGLDVGGGVYLLPSRFGLLGISYNKTILEEHGWAVPTSFAELKDLAPEIEAAGYRVADMTSHLTGTTFGAFFALGNTNYFGTPEGAQWKEDFLEGKATAVGALEGVTDYVQQWIDAGLITTRYYDDRTASANDDFDNGEYVFQLYSNRSSTVSGDAFGFMPFLSEDGSNNMLVRLVTRYYGLNKSLGEPGNSQKLADALKVIGLMATPEGQAALSGGSLTQIPSASINDLPADSPYADVLDLINSGSMVDMVYAGWEDHIVPLMECYGNEWIRGNITAGEFLAGMDTLNRELLSGGGAEVLAVAPEDLSLEDAARLCAIAQGKAAGADAALIALPGFHGFSDSGANLENRWGVHSGIFQGDITSECVSIFSPGSGSILTVDMTGREILALAEAGFTVEGDPTPFGYCLATRDGLELDPDGTYTLAVGSAELSDGAVLERATDTGLAPQQAVTDHIKALGTVTPVSIRWD